MSAHRSASSLSLLTPVLAVVACLLIAATGRGQAPYRLPPLPQSGPGGVGQAKAARRDAADDGSSPMEPAIAAVSANSLADDQGTLGANPEIQPGGAAPIPTIAASYAESTQGVPAEAAALPSYAELSRRLQALEARMNEGAVAKGTEIKEVPLIDKPTFKLRGWIAAEQLAVEDTPISGPLKNFSGFRSLRLGCEGNIAENIRYAMEWELFGDQIVNTNLDDIRIKDVYTEFENLPWVGHFRVGHFKEPFSLEENISDRLKVFVERSTATQVFSPKRNFGMMIYDSVGEGDYLTWFTGVFNADVLEQSLGYAGDSNDLAMTTRVAWLPYFDEATPGRYLVHLGAAVSTRRTVNPIADNGDYIPTVELDSYRTGLRATLPARSEFMLYGTEFAWANGPFALMNEFYFVNTGAAEGNFFWGGYVEASYFLTGENRSYKKLEKEFDRTYPYENFFAVRTADGVARGWGAWQVAGRASYVDLDTNGRVAPGAVLGTQLNLSADLHWYLTPYCQLVGTYVHPISTVQSSGLVAQADDFGLRFQVDW